jgi:hypothetical protein
MQYGIGEQTVRDLKKKKDSISFASSSNSSGMANQVHDGEEVNEENIREWFDCDSCEPGFEMLSRDKIVSSVGVQPEEREERRMRKRWTVLPVRLKRTVY